MAYTALGIDMFDCVLPTRFGRTGTAFGPAGRVNLVRSRFASDFAPIDPNCDCLTCERFSRAALHSAARSASPLGARLISMHNVRALTRTAERARAAVINGTFQALLAQSVECFSGVGGQPDGTFGGDRESGALAASG